MHLTQKIYDKIDKNYAIRFRKYYISKDTLNKKQDNIIMNIRPSMMPDIKAINAYNGLYFYSMWQGYRANDSQIKLGNHLIHEFGFALEMLHTSGHASISDIKKTITGLNPKQVIPIHTSHPELFLNLSDKVVLKNDEIPFIV